MGTRRHCIGSSIVIVFSTLLIAASPSACVSDDTGALDGGSTSTSASSGSTSSSSSGGAQTNRSVNCESAGPCTGNDLCCGVGTDWIGLTCKASCAGAYELGCDDASDCPTGKVCCMLTDGGRRAKSTFCADSCMPLRAQRQLCRVNPPSDECKNVTCTPLSQFSPEGLATCGPLKD